MQSTSIKIDPELWKEIRKAAIDEEITAGEFLERACRERLSPSEKLNSSSYAELNTIYTGGDPEGKAETILEKDSEKWAKEFLTTPTDTPMDKAEELRKKHQKPRIQPNPYECEICTARFSDENALDIHRSAIHNNELPSSVGEGYLNKRLTDRELQKRFEVPKDYNKDKDRIYDMYEKAQGLSTKKKHDQIRALAEEWGIERLRKANPPWADFIEEEEEKKK